MKFPGTICFVTAGLVVATVSALPKLVGLTIPRPHLLEGAELATSEMVADPPPPDALIVAIGPEPEEEPLPIEEPRMARQEASPPAKQEPVRESVTQLDVVNSAPPLAPAPQRVDTVQVLPLPPDRVETSRSQLDSIQAPQLAAPRPQAMDIAQALPEEARQTFLSLLDQGARLHRTGATTPAYRATIPVDMADRLIAAGIFRAGVAHHGTRLFVFADGGLSDARSPTLAGAADTQGFSSRVIALDRAPHARLVHQVAQRFGIPPEELTPCLLVHSQLDSAVLATQYQAAAQHGLTLDEVASTTGRFEYAEGGVPFTYSIAELQDKQGQRIRHAGGARPGSQHNSSRSVTTHAFLPQPGV